MCFGDTVNIIIKKSARIKTRAQTNQIKSSIN